MPSCVPADARHPPEVLLGDDLCLRSLWQLRGLRGPGQHLLHLQPENQGGQRACEPGAAGAHRSAESPAGAALREALLLGAESARAA